MKGKICVLIFLCLLGVSLPCYGESEPFWIYGEITSMPAEVSYNNITYFEFQFSVNSSSVDWITYPTDFTVVMPVSIIIDVALNLQQVLNLTGIVNVLGLPDGSFLAQGINRESGDSSWIATVKLLWFTVSTIGRIIVTLIVQVIQAFTGLQFPSWTVSLVVVGLTAITFLKLFKKLPWILLLALFFMCAAIVSNLITSLMLT